MRPFSDYVYVGEMTVVNERNLNGNYTRIMKQNKNKSLIEKKLTSCKCRCRNSEIILILTIVKHLVKRRKQAQANSSGEQK